MTAQNRNYTQLRVRRTKFLGALKWTLYIVVLLGIIATTFVVAILTE